MTIDEHSNVYSYPYIDFVTASTQQNSLDDLIITVQSDDYANAVTYSITASVALVDFPEVKSTASPFALEVVACDFNSVKWL